MIGSKKLCIIICAVLLVSIMFTGCIKKDVQSNGEMNPTKLDTGKEVKLSMILIGDAPKDYNTMLTELNKLIKKDINATLEVKWLGWAEWKQRYPLLAASGEPFDLIYTSDWAMYSSQAAKGAFLALDDLLPQYAPKSYSEEPKEAWEQARKDGKIYMVPMNYMEVNPQGYVVRGDLRKKYNIGPIKTLDDFGQYLDAVAKNEKGIIPFNAGAHDMQFGFLYLGYTNGWDTSGISTEVNLIYQINESSGDISKTYELPAYEEFINKARSWYLNGYWSKDALVNRTDAKDSLMNEKSASTILNLLKFNELYLKVKDKYPQWELEWYEIAPDAPKVASKYTTNGIAVGANSNNPERALMLLELLRNDETYFDLTTYGMKGKNYEINADGKLTLPAGINAADNGFPPDNACPWGWRQEKFYKSYANAWTEFSNSMQEAKKHFVISKGQSFLLNEDDLKNEIAAISSVKQQYEMPLLWGVVDPNEGLEILKQKMKEAGIDKVKRELETQWGEYLKSSK